jgi:hypothetical protein
LSPPPIREPADAARAAGFFLRTPRRLFAFGFVAVPEYDSCVDRAVHDRGGCPTNAPIDRTEHELADWELLADALVGALASKGVINVDELRRGIESMPPDEYERASYYERWLFSAETLLVEKGVLAPGELDARIDC